jgi:hypothetical protein
MRQVKPTVDDTTRDAVLTAFNRARSKTEPPRGVDGEIRISSAPI